MHPLISTVPPLHLLKPHKQKNSLPFCGKEFQNLLLIYSIKKTKYRMKMTNNAYMIG